MGNSPIYNIMLDYKITEWCGDFPEDCKYIYNVTTVQIFFDTIVKLKTDINKIMTAVEHYLTSETQSCCVILAKCAQN